MMRLSKFELPSTSSRKELPTTRELKLVALLCAIVVSLFLSHALFTGRILSSADLLYEFQPWHKQQPQDWKRASNLALSDPVLQFEPWLKFTTERLRSGSLPLWNPNNMIGAPFIANMQSAVFSPLNWPYFLWPNNNTLLLRIWLKLFIAAMGIYILVRQTFHKSALAASFAALTFPFCAFFTVWLLYPHTGSAAWLPWLWWATARIIDVITLRRISTLAVIVGLQIVAGHPEMTYFAALSAGAFALFWTGKQRPLQLKRSMLGLACCALAYCLGAMLAAVQLLPFAEYLSISATLAHRSQLAGSDIGFPIRYAWTAIVPGMFGNHADNNWWDVVANYNEMNVYSGLAALILAPFALLESKKMGRGLSIFLFCLIGLILGVVYGWPIIHPLITALPLLGVAATGRLMLIAEFAIILLGALGLEAISVRASKEQKQLLATLLMVLVTLLIFGVGIPALTAHTYFRLPINQQPAIDIWNLALQRPIWLTVILSLSLSIAILSARRRRTLAQSILGLIPLLAFLDLWSIHGKYNPTISSKDYYPTTDLIRFLQKQSARARYIATGWTFMPNTNMVYDIDSFSGYDAVVPQLYQELVGYIDPSVQAGGGLSPFQRIQSRLLNLVNIRYVITVGGNDPNYLLDVYQDINGNMKVDDILGDYLPGQTFTATRGNLSRIQVLGTVFGDQPEGDLIFHLKTSPSATTDIVTQKIDAKILTTNRYWTFTFTPIADAKDRSFYFYLEAPSVRRGQGLSVWYNRRDQYLGGTRTENGIPAKGDLVFRTYALLDPDKPWFVPIFEGSGAHIYENTQVLPRAWMTYRVVVEPDKNARLNLLRNPDFDRLGVAVLTKDLLPEQVLPAELSSNTAKVDIIHYAPEEVSILTNSTSPGILVLADQSFPGWEAEVNGQLVEILTVDHALRGVYVPAGTNQVEFRYRPLSFTIGAILSVLGLIIICSLYIWPIVNKRDLGENGGQ